MEKVRGFFEKEVSFAGEKRKLYSLDGVSWASEKSSIQSQVKRMKEAFNKTSESLRE